MSNKAPNCYGTIDDSDGERYGDCYLNGEALGLEKIQVDDSDEEVVIDIDVERAVSDEQKLAIDESAAVAEMKKERHKGGNGNKGDCEVEGERQVVNTSERQNNQSEVNDD